MTQRATPLGSSRAHLLSARSIFAAGCLFLSAACAFAQELPPLLGTTTTLDSPYSRDSDSQPSRTATSSSDQNSQPRRDTNANEDATGSSTVLSANQIIGILHQRSEAIVDVKRVMADYFYRRGISVQESSITDEMLFSNIATNAELRQTISAWLRARGYASDAAFDESPEPTSDIERPDGISNESTRNAEDDGTNGMSQLELALRNLPADSELIPQNSTSQGSLNQNSTNQNLSNPNSADQDSRNQSLIDRSNNQTPQLNRRPRTDDRQPPPKKPERADADTIELLHQTAPYNLQALRDLYTQVPDQTVQVKRFGAEVFLTRGMATKEMPIDLPIGPDYVLGPGDSLTISLWGGISQSFSRVIDREGKIVLPEAGSIVVAGLTLERTQALVQGALALQFKDAHVAVSVSRLRTVRVYVVGDVQRPGAYDISSLSTPLNALYAAGGPTNIGSLRTVRHYRGNSLIREVDLYDFLLHGIRSDVERMEPGDTILVPAAGPQVEVSGMVKRPAIYELKTSMKLSDVLDQAGGVRVSAALSHIRIERIDPDGHRSTLEVGVPQGSTAESAHAQLDSFMVRDGDRVIVAPILPYSEKAIYVTGHVVRPGKLPYHDGIKLSDALHSYQDLLPEPSDHGEIIRLMPPDLRPQAIDFSVADVLTGGATIFLQPFDTIRIRGRYESDAPKVTVRGEVLQPGPYALAQGMTAAQLVRIAGGFKRSALLDQADLASYEIVDGKQVVSRRRDVAIGLAVNGRDANADVPLKPGDVLTVHQVSGWNDIGASVTLAGEVTYPGTYGLQEGEKLSSVIQRAGGFRTTAYPDGAVLVRKQVKELEEKTRSELIHQIESTSVGGKLGQSVSGGDESGTLQLLVQQQNQVLQRLRTQQAVGRLVIKINGDVASWANTPADIELRSGDVLTVPKRPGIVLVTGQVYNATAITYVPGKDADWYLRRAGGATDLANRKEIFVIRANGLVVGRRSSQWYQEKVLGAKLNPGDVVVVPQKIVGGSVFWKNMLATAQVVSSIAFTAALALK
ncbi:MAG TPA: SLBB domain-containing protein [Acidobacteriaceae bacterium]